jgi:hypothetical protein
MYPHGDGKALVLVAGRSYDVECQTIFAHLISDLVALDRIQRGLNQFDASILRIPHTLGSIPLHFCSQSKYYSKIEEERV